MKIKRTAIAIAAVSVVLACAVGMSACSSKKNTGNLKVLSPDDVYNVNTSEWTYSTPEEIDELSGYTLSGSSLYSMSDSNGTYYKYYDLLTNKVKFDLSCKTESTTKKELAAMVTHDGDLCGYVVCAYKSTTSLTTTYTYTLYSVGGVTLASAETTEKGISGSISIPDYKVVNFADCINSDDDVKDTYITYDSETESLVTTSAPSKFKKYATAYDIEYSGGEVFGNYGYVQIGNVLHVYNIDKNIVGDEAYSFEFDEGAETSWWLLSNGNVLVETKKQLALSDSDYDMYYVEDGECAIYEYDHYVCNLEKGKMKSIKMNYIVGEVYSGEDIDGGLGIISDSVENIIIGYKTIDGQCNPEDASTIIYASVTNAGKTSGISPMSEYYEPIIPVGNGVYTDMSGDYIYSKDGDTYNEIGYIGAASYRNSKYIVLDKVIYNYSLEKVGTIGEDEHVVRMTDNGILIADDDGTYTYLDSEGNKKKIASGSSSVSDSDKYVYVLKNTTGSSTTYTLKNYAGETLISATTGYISCSCTTVDNNNMVYLVKVTPNLISSLISAATATTTSTQYYRFTMSR